ncbi:hypothetical protein GCM10012286_62610 [Streptomyces lasiicapitis]|uniref:Transposase n=1 Tax=Streptomyces lasiicapitis TaxID=1923961 RepID=A0ABQ2MMA2_9ACTN|nr:hypothetical protein GCM10012286_62610 [Streptomyces lasiicapitis]
MGARGPRCCHLLPNGSGLGKIRRVAERAFAWLHYSRRLRTRYCRGLSRYL